jgi:hypothetical protein
VTELVEPPKNEASARFRAMADAIDHNAATQTFGGAVVIIPPVNAGEPIEMLVLDLKADPAQFWSTIKTRIEIKLAELDEQQRKQQAFGGIR